MTTPTLQVSLSPEGDLLLHLPGAAALGDRRIALREGFTDSGESRLAQTLRRVLRAQADRQYEIGSDGAPTERQVRHWERHQLFADDRCPFCLAEGRLALSRDSLRKRAAQRTVLSSYGGVTVRRIAAKGKGARGAAKVCMTSGSAAELGF